MFTWHLLIVAIFLKFPSSLCDKKKYQAARRKMHVVRRGKMKILSSRLHVMRLSPSVVTNWETSSESQSLCSDSRTTKATRKEEEGALSGGSLASTAPVDSRNIFARLTEPLGRRLLVRPIDVWAKLLSDLLLTPAFVFFRSEISALNPSGKRGEADPSSLRYL